MGRILARIMLAFSLLSAAAVSLAQDTDRTDYYTPENIYRFARHLYETEDYQPAAGEFLRYLHYSGLDSDPPDSILYIIGLCYRRSAQYLKAEDLFWQLASGSSTPDYRDSAIYQSGYSLFQAGLHHESISRLTSSLPDLSSPEAGSRVRRLLGLNHLFQKNWKDAFLIYDTLVQFSPFDTTSLLFRNFAERGINLPYKSPVIAGVLSTIIPGSGKMYARRFSDGMFSLLVIGLTTWQAYDGFSEDGTKSTKGWIYGTISGILYTGNIYGSIVTVKLHNRQIEDRLLKRIEAEVNFYFD